MKGWGKTIKWVTKSGCITSRFLPEGEDSCKKFMADSGIDFLVRNSLLKVEVKDFGCKNHGGLRNWDF